MTVFLILLFVFLMFAAAVCFTCYGKTDDPLPFMWGVVCLFIAFGVFLFEKLS